MKTDWLNREKFKNSIRLDMDKYHLGGVVNWDTMPSRYKKYEFELFEEDIIKSPFNHVIWACEMNIKVLSIYEIDQLMEFLENLKRNMFGAKKEENEAIKS
jgi:hypothetical protein